MQREHSSANFMSDIYSRMKARKGEASLMNQDSTVIDTNLGPCMVIGALSWLVLFSLYHWLA